MRGARDEPLRSRRPGLVGRLGVEERKDLLAELLARNCPKEPWGLLEIEFAQLAGARPCGEVRRDDVLEVEDGQLGRAVRERGREPVDLGVQVGGVRG